MEFQNAEELLASQKGIKGFVRKVAYKIIRPMLDIEMESVRKNSANTKDLVEKIACDVNTLESSVHESRLVNRVEVLEINIRNNNEILSRLQTKTTEVENSILNLSKYTLDINNKLDEKLVVANLNKNSGGSASQVSERTESSSITSSEDTYVGIDYFDFENHFRGSEEHIKNVQRQYVQYYSGKKNVVDIGCGRGEFLQLMKENDIPTTGIDSYNKSVEWCKLKGLNVLHGDGIKYLKEYKGSVDGIFAGQVVEHLTIGQIIELCNACYEVLEDGCYMILETPNPTSLAMYTNAFYVDPSHVKPVHPLTLEYCAKKAGFKEIEILYTKNSEYPVKIPMVKSDSIDNLEEFNSAMQVVSDVLFGSQDYAIIAKK